MDGAAVGLIISIACDCVPNPEGGAALIFVAARVDDAEDFSPVLIILRDFSAQYTTMMRVVSGMRPTAAPINATPSMPRMQWSAGPQGITLAVGVSLLDPLSVADRDAVTLLEDVTVAVNEIVPDVLAVGRLEEV